MGILMGKENGNGLNNPKLEFNEPVNVINV